MLLNEIDFQLLKIKHTALTDPGGGGARDMPLPSFGQIVILFWAEILLNNRFLHYSHHLQTFQLD